MAARAPLTTASHIARCCRTASAATRTTALVVTVRGAAAQGGNAQHAARCRCRALRPPLRVAGRARQLRAVTGAVSSPLAEITGAPGVRVAAARATRLHDAMGLVAVKPGARGTLGDRTAPTRTAAGVAHRAARAARCLPHCSKNRRAETQHPRNPRNQHPRHNKRLLAVCRAQPQMRRQDSHDRCPRLRPQPESTRVLRSFQVGGSSFRMPPVHSATSGRPA